jgi:hypothetical protein
METCRISLAELHASDQSPIKACHETNFLETKMKSLFSALIVLVAAQPSLASFARTDCTNADATIKYHYEYHWSGTNLDSWTIYDRNFPGDSTEILIERSDKQILESHEDEMSVSSVYIEKNKITLLKPDAEAEVFTAWLLCNSGSGI